MRKKSMVTHSLGFRKNIKRQSADTGWVNTTVERVGEEC